MSVYRYAALCTLSIALLSFYGPAACAQSAPKAIVVRPDASGANKQELILNGLKTSRDAAGVRVFLDPGPGGSLDPQSKSYVGSVYFSDQKDPNSKEGSFVLPLTKKVTGPTRVVMYPISPKGAPLSADVQVQEARIKPVDNSSFQ